MGNNKGKLSEGQTSKKQEEPKKPLNELDTAEDQGSLGNQSNHGNGAGGTSAAGMVDIFSLVRSGNHTGVERLLQEGKLDVNMEDEDGHTPLMLANDLNMLRVLLKYQANVRAQSSKTCTTALQEAILNDRCDDVIALLQQEEDKALECIGQLFTVNGPLPDLMPGVSVDVRGEDGCTPLMVHAAGDSNADLVVKLLDLGAQVDCQDKKGNTALMCAVEGGHLETVKELMARGCSVNIENKVGKKALDIARDKKFSEIEEVLGKAVQKPLVTFESLLARFLSRPRPPKSADTSADSKHPLPFLAPPTGEIPQEIKEQWEAIAKLETEVHELTLMTSADDPSDMKDDSTFSFMELPRLEEEYKKMVEQKEKMISLAVDAKIAAQRLNAENIQLKEDLNNLRQRHEAEKKELLKNLEGLHQEATRADKHIESLQQAMQIKKRVSSCLHVPVIPDGGVLQPKKCVLKRKSLSEMNYDIEVSLLRVVITGLPNCGKSKIWDHLIPKYDTRDCIENKEVLSVRETILTSDGHSWKWMQVSKTEASALVVGAGISQAYAKEGLSPDFIIPDDDDSEKDMDTIWESVSTGKHVADTKRLSLINIWDVGANRVLFDLLPLLLLRSKRLVVLSVVGLDSDAGDMHSHMHEGKHGQEVLREPYSKLDYLMAPPSIARCHTVVVGTHDGKLSRDRLRARQRRVERLVGANAEEMGMGKMLYPKCIAVDTSNQGDVVKIRNVLEKVAINSCEHNVEVPLTWVCLRDNLLRECDWYITKEMLCKAAKQLGITNQQDVEKWLELYSECGSIIYLDELRDYIILKPSTFFSKVQKLYAEAKKAGHGRIHELAKQLWRKEDCGSEFLLKIFEYLGLMVKIDDISAGNSSSGKVMRYYMPSLCLESPPIAEELSSLFVVLPRASLSSTHLARFVKFIKVLHSSKGIKYVDNEKNQYWNQLHLQLYREPQLANVNICIVDNHLEVKVTCAPQGKDGVQVLRKACSVFKTVIIDFFQHIGKDSYELSLLCPPSVQSGMPHFISFHPLDKEDPSKRGMLFCGQCRRDVGIEDSALEWLRADYEGPKLSALKPQDVISIDLMVKLSHDLSTITPQQMEALGCALGCSNANTEMMMKCSSMQECILSLLQMWVRNYHLPTKERLAQALKKSGCLDMTVRLTASNNHMSSVLSLDELQVISQQVSQDCTVLKKELQIDDPETDCYKLLETWSKRKESSRDGLISALFSCGCTSAAEFLFIKNDAFRMLK